MIYIIIIILVIKINCTWVFLMLNLMTGMIKKKKQLLTCIYVQTQKHTRSRFSKLMYFFSMSKVYLKQTFNIDVFILKFRSILEVDFLNLCICLWTLKYTWSRLSVLMYLFWDSNVYLKYFLNWRIYVETQKYIWSRFPKWINSFQTQKYSWSILHFRKSQEV